MWMKVSFTPDYVYNIYKLTCTPIIFQCNHIWCGPEFIVKYLIDIYCSPVIAGLFDTIWFSFSYGFPTASPGDQLWHECINYRFLFILYQIKTRFYLFISPWKMSGDILNLNSLIIEYQFNKQASLRYIQGTSIYEILYVYFLRKTPWHGKSVLAVQFLCWCLFISIKLPNKTHGVTFKPCFGWIVVSLP